MNNLLNNDSSPLGRKNIDTSLAVLYHENSKYSKCTVNDDLMKFQLFYNETMIERSSRPFKIFPNSDIIFLPDISKNSISLDFSGLIMNRRTMRKFNKEEIVTLTDLSAILKYSYGVLHKEPIIGLSSQRDGYFGYRAVPSAGALYPLELYYISFRGELSQGLYHYRPEINGLEQLKKGMFLDEIDKLIVAVPKVDLSNSAGVFICTGIIERVLLKYGERGYRFMMIESGEVNQMLSLVSSSLNIGSCTIGVYNDDRLSDFIGTDSVFESINNVLIIGK